MTVSSTTTKVSYSGDGSTAVFAYTFKVFNASELVVITRVNATGAETTETLNTAYIVDGVENANGGNVTFKYNTGNPADPNYSVTDFRPQTGETVVIKRVLPLTQTTDYTPNDPFPAEVHEESLDRLTFMSQQQQEEIDRSFKFAETDAGTASIPVASERANKYLAFDAEGNVVAAQGSTSDVIASTFGASLIDDSDASAARTTLGLGNLATLNTVGSSQIDADSVTTSELNISGNGTSGQYVTSDGDGSFSYTTPPAFAGRLINIQSFTSSGTYTPNASALQSIVYVQGAGGGGGGSDSDSSAQAGMGAGGNGGGYIQSGFIDVSSGSYSSTITVGSGGTGGAGAVSGSAGNDSVYNDGTISLTAKGGGGGNSVADLASPNVALPADTAANTVANHVPVLNIGTNQGGNGISMESSGADNRASGGSGGGSFFGYGGGGGATSSTSDFPGNNGVGFGSGGGGAAVSGAISGGDYPGGDGADGIVIIYEYT